jgi:hypothetical protein
MGFFKRVFGSGGMDGAKLAASSDKGEYAQIELLGCFESADALAPLAERQRWGRVLPQSYDETIRLFVKEGWLEHDGGAYHLTTAATPFVTAYRLRQEAEKAAVMAQVRNALKAKDTSEALDLRRAYEARQPLGKADWTGPEPQMSHSALTRRILYLTHPLLDGMSPQTVDWLRHYAAEQHLWGTSWRVKEDSLPESVRGELASHDMTASESAFWKSIQLSLLVENQDTWQRLKGGDHVRRIEIAGPDDEFTCDVCRPLLGKQYLVARAPELPPAGCTSVRGCRCRYEPVLESYE